MDVKHRKTSRTRRRGKKQKGGVSLSGLTRRAARGLIGSETLTKLDKAAEGAKKYMGEKAKKFSEATDLGITTSANNFIERHESLKTVKYAAKEGVSSLKNAAKFAANFDTRYIDASIKIFVNAADVDRVIAKNQGFMAFINFDQIKQMYKYEYDKDVKLYRVEGTNFFNGIYLYERNYLVKYLKEQKDKHTASGTKVSQNPDDKDPGEIKVENKKEGDGGNELENLAEKQDEAEDADNAFIECGTMPAWSETLPLALLNDFKLVDPFNINLKYNTFDQAGKPNVVGKIKYISFYKDFDIFYRILFNYKYQLSRSFWNASEMLLMRHIKFLLRVNYAFIKRHQAVSDRFKKDSGSLLYPVKQGNAIMKAIMSRLTVDMSDEKEAAIEGEEKKAEIAAANAEEATEEGTPGNSSVDSTPQGNSSVDSKPPSNSLGGSEPRVNPLDEQSGGGYIESRILMKLKKYYNYNDNNLYLNPKSVDAEAVFAIIFAIDMLTRKDYGVNNLDKIKEFDMTELSDPKNLIKKIYYKDTGYTFNFRVEGEKKVENEVDMRKAKISSKYLLEDTDLYKEVIDKNKTDNLGIYKWVQKLYDTYKKSKSPPQGPPQASNVVGGDMSDAKDFLKNAASFTASAAKTAAKKTYKGVKTVSDAVPGVALSVKKSVLKGTDLITPTSITGTSEFYDFLNVVFDKCYRFMTQRFVWEMERLYMEPKERPKPDLPQKAVKDDYIRYSFEENVYYLMMCINQTKIDGGNTFSNTLLFNLIGTVAPGGLAMTAHLVVTSRLLALYMGNLADLLTPLEKKTLSGFFKPTHVQNFTKSHKIEDIFKKFNNLKKESGGKLFVEIPLKTGAVIGELIRITDKTRGIAQLKFTLVEQDNNPIEPSDTKKTEAEESVPCFKYKNFKFSKEIYLAEKINKVYSNVNFDSTDDTWTITEVASSNGDTGTGAKTAEGPTALKVWSSATYQPEKSPIYIGFNGIYSGVLEKITIEKLSRFESSKKKTEKNKQEQKTNQGGNLRKKKTKRNINPKYIEGGGIESILNGIGSATGSKSTVPKEPPEYIIFHVILKKTVDIRGSMTLGNGTKIQQIYYKKNEIGTKDEYISKPGVKYWAEIYESEGGARNLNADSSTPKEPAEQEYPPPGNPEEGSPAPGSLAAESSNGDSTTTGSKEGDIQAKESSKEGSTAPGSTPDAPDNNGNNKLDNTRLAESTTKPTPSNAVCRIL